METLPLVTHRPRFRLGAILFSLSEYGLFLNKRLFRRKFLSTF